VHRVVAAVLQGELGAERPADEPRVGQAALEHELHGRRDIRPLGHAVAEAALAAAAGGLRAAGVEAQHREVRLRGQPGGGLAEDVRVHEPAGRRQRMQRHERGDRVAIRRQRELADERQTVLGLELDVLPSCRQDRSGADLHGCVRHDTFQQCVCQCRLASRSLVSPRGPSARQATRCSVPGAMSRPQPGQV
jgi:hypothetical protein